MTIDVDTEDSPGWWLKRLYEKLEARNKVIGELYDRYEGNAPTPKSLERAPDTAKAFFKTARTNFEEMIVKAVRYRLGVSAIMLQGASGADQELGDPEAWERWRRSGMMAEQHDVHRHMGICGNGYVITASYEGELAATAEDPRQVITIHDPVRQSRIRAGAKFFFDEDFKVNYAYLYRPDPSGTGGRRWVARKDDGNAKLKFNSGWDWDETKGGEDGEEVPIPMPIVRYRSEEGIGEFQRHVDILDRIDHLILQGMAIATFQAFKQRGIKADWTEVEDTGEDEKGKEIDLDNVLEADPGAVWKLPMSAELWESGAVDLRPITDMATKEIERLSAVTFTPLWMFAQEGQNQSGAGVHLVREGLTSKVGDRADRAAYSHAQVVANLYQIDGATEQPAPEDITIVWKPIERYGLEEKYRAATAAVAAGVPWRTRMKEVLQFTPAEIIRMESERIEDQLLFGLPEPAGPGGASASTV